MSWSESACHHVLVLVVGQSPLGAAPINLADKWRTKLPGTHTILPVLLPTVPHGPAMAGTPTWFSRLQTPQWGGSPDVLARTILADALHGERPRLFVSYRRADTAALADQLFGALTEAGCHVYLDRFTNSPGRHFPNEIAEELADKNVVLALESSNLPLSKWTLWEIGFARRFSLGRIALNCNHAPRIKAINNSDRMQVTCSARGELTSTDLDSAVKFLLKRHALAALSRAAFYQEMINQAAVRRGGSVISVGGGLYEIVNSAHSTKALVFPSGRPGQLEDAHRLATNHFGSPSVARILAGQHQHLPWHKRQSLEWLAQETRIELLDAYACYRELMRIV